MPYLKGVKCERCGGRLLINGFYDKEENKHYIDGATCQNCFKNAVLPDEPYNEFVREHGER